MNKTLKLVICAIGIFVCYFYYGILQERITRGTYHHEGKQERFTFILALVGIQCVINALYAFILNRYVVHAKEDTTRPSYYAAASLSYLLAMVFSNKALQWVNYPTQVVGKSCKPIPVMLLGVLLGQRRHPLRKYLFVLLIVTGVAVFMYKDGQQANTAESHHGAGEVLLLLSLTMDGLTGAMQERMTAEFRSSSGHLMYNMNLWGVMYLTVALVGSGELFSFLSFVERHPQVCYQLLSFSVASALGQYFIFMTISDFGPLPCSIITTTRKFFTVLGSVLLFGNTLTTRQWLGAVAVFTGLFLDSTMGKSRATPTPAEDKPSKAKLQQ